MAIPENPITRKERYLAKAAGENVNTPDPITREEMYLDAIASGSGGSGGGGGGADNRFIVMCTPTAQDYSGTMDATGLYNAYKSGKNIFFAIGGTMVPAAVIHDYAEDNRAAFKFYMILEDNNLLIVGYSTVISSGTETTSYSTKIYPLTPMGG